MTDTPPLPAAAKFNRDGVCVLDHAIGLHPHAIIQLRSMALTEYRHVVWLSKKNQITLDADFVTFSTLSAGRYLIVIERLAVPQDTWNRLVSELVPSQVLSALVGPGRLDPTATRTLFKYTQRSFRSEAYKPPTLLPPDRVLNSMVSLATDGCQEEFTPIWNLTPVPLADPTPLTGDVVMYRPSVRHFDGKNELKVPRVNMITEYALTTSLSPFIVPPNTPRLPVSWEGDDFNQALQWPLSLLVQHFSKEVKPDAIHKGLNMGTACQVLISQLVEGALRLRAGKRSKSARRDTDAMYVTYPVSSYVPSDPERELQALALQDGYETVASTPEFKRDVRQLIEATMAQFYPLLDSNEPMEGLVRMRRVCMPPGVTRISTSMLQRISTDGEPAADAEVWYSGTAKDTKRPLDVLHVPTVPCGIGSLDLYTLQFVFVAHVIGPFFFSVDAATNAVFEAYFDAMNDASRVKTEWRAARCGAMLLKNKLAFLTPKENAPRMYIERGHGWVCAVDKAVALDENAEKGLVHIKVENASVYRFDYAKTGFLAWTCSSPDASCFGSGFVTEIPEMWGWSTVLASMTSQEHVICRVSDEKTMYFTVCSMPNIIEGLGDIAQWHRNRQGSAMSIVQELETVIMHCVAAVEHAMCVHVDKLGKGSLECVLDLRDWTEEGFGLSLRNSIVVRVLAYLIHMTMPRAYGVGDVAMTLIRHNEADDAMIEIMRQKITLPELSAKILDMIMAQDASPSVRTDPVEPL